MGLGRSCGSGLIGGCSNNTGGLLSPSKDGHVWGSGFRVWGLGELGLGFALSQYWSALRKDSGDV